MEQRMDPSQFTSLQADWPHWKFSTERGGLMLSLIHI